MAVFVAVLGVDGGAGVNEKPWPETVKATSRIASRCISIRLISSFQIARWRKASTGIVPSSSALIRWSRLRLNAAVTPGRVVIGGEQDIHVLDPVHADDEARALAQSLLHRAEQVDRGARDQIADRRAGKEAELGRGGDLGRADRAGA